MIFFLTTFWVLVFNQIPDTTEKKTFSADELWLKIALSGTRKLMSLVIANFTVSSSVKAETIALTQAIQELFTADLRFSRYFTFEEPESGKVYTFSTDQKKPDLKGWATTGAEVLICGDLIPKRNGAGIGLRLYDLASSRLIASKIYQLTGNYRWIAHKMADEVIKLLTGEDGVSCTRIAFSQKFQTGHKELVAVDYDGHNLEQLTSSGGMKLYPDWSPNGDQIAFCSYSDRSLNIYFLEVSSRRVTTIIDRKGLNTTPAFSPDGKLLAMSLTLDGNSDIYLMSSNGKNLRRLTSSPAIDISPSFSPSGREIAFVSDRTGTPQIYIINIDGTDERRLTFFGSYNTSPAWSPKGDLIAFVQRQPDGSNQICVTNILGDTYYRLTSSGNNEDPAWSPDGLHIAFVSNRTGTWEIYTMDWNGANQNQITRTGGAQSPTWSPRLNR
ncbi:MAG: Tol-Pal system beta propeller repeat protein TolB [bacterium]